MNRSERRRLEREIEKTKPAKGIGLGWRLTTPNKYGIRKKYKVYEKTKVTNIEYLELESDKVKQRMNIVTD